MEKLLQWSIANQTGDESAKAKVPAPDPEQLAQLFGTAVDEPTLMKQNMSLIVNPEADLENKTIAFENFEMLIENIDNANNIENLKLWEPLLSQLSSSKSSLQAFACSCIGTAVQNNPKAQEDFLKYAESENGLQKVVSLAQDEKSSAPLKLKAIYALSNFLRHNESAYPLFDKVGGWEIIAPILNDESSTEKLKLRALSLLSALLSTGINDEKLKKIHDDDVVKSMLKLIKTDTHIGCVDNVLNLLATLISNQYKFDDEENQSIQELVKELEKMKDQISLEDFQTIRTYSKIAYLKSLKMK